MCTLIVSLWEVNIELPCIQFQSFLDITIFFTFNKPLKLNGKSGRFFKIHFQSIVIKAISWLGQFSKMCLLPDTN